jgi:hypothetical protein
MNHQVELFRPLRTLLAEMPRLTTSMRSVFHGSVAFPFLSSSIRKVYFAASLSQGVQVKKLRLRGGAKVLNVLRARRFDRSPKTGIGERSTLERTEGLL